MDQDASNKSFNIAPCGCDCGCNLKIAGAVIRDQKCSFCTDGMHKSAKEQLRD